MTNPYSSNGCVEIYLLQMYRTNERHGSKHGQISPKASLKIEVIIF